MRKSFIIIIIVFFAFLLALWSPWVSWNLSFSNLFGVTPPEIKSGLSVSSLVGDLEVFIDGESVGKVGVDDSPLYVPGINPGERQVKLVRASAVPGAYYEFNRLISFPESLNVVLAYELGPTEEFSQGHIIYATPKPDGGDKTYLNITSSTDSADIYLDDVLIGQSPLREFEVSRSLQHKVRISALSYDDHELTLLPEKQDERNDLAGYDVTVIVDLFLQPIQVK